MTALFIGGHEDGKFRTVSADSIVLRMPFLSSRELQAHWTADGPPEPTDLASFSVVNYRRQEVGLFGMRIAVWVDESLTGRVADLAIARHLLSPIANRLISEATT